MSSPPLKREPKSRPLLRKPGLNQATLSQSIGGRFDRFVSQSRLIVQAALLFYADT